MKKLKKFAALLLVGVMALALLTACGGGGGSSAGTVKTEEETKAVNLIGTAHGSTKNDSTLRAVAEGHLDVDYRKLDAKFKYRGYVGAFKFYAEPVGNDLVITMIARYDYDDTRLSNVLEQISKHVDTNHKVTVNQDGDWTKVGVVVKGNNEQSYIGISISIKNIYK